MVLFLICCSVAVSLGVCSYLSLVRPGVRSHARTLDEIRLLETWWDADASDVALASAAEDPDRVDDAA